MLAAEEARAALEAIADNNWVADVRLRAERFDPAERRDTIETLLPCDVDGRSKDPLRWLEAVIGIAEGLDELADDELRSVMEALHPELGSTLAAWWVAARREPYTVGWHRRAYRAPHSPATTHRQRADLLIRLIAATGPYRRPVEWFAAWAPYLSLASDLRPVTGGFGFGSLLACAIDAGGPTGEATFQTLIDSATGVHPTGRMDRHVIVGLLRSSRPDGWAFIESMLMAAQREEGLRQAILESADEANPEAFTRIIELILNENLLRFAATIRAVGVWMGLDQRADRIEVAENHLRLLESFRVDRALAADRIVDGDVWETYIALCAVAQFDVEPALALAYRALDDPDRDKRAAALRFLASTQLSDEPFLQRLIAATADPDLTVACLAHQIIDWWKVRGRQINALDALKALADRLGSKPVTADPIGIEQAPISLDRAAVLASMVIANGNRPLEPLLEYLPSMDPGTRWSLVRQAKERPRLSPEVRRALVTLVGDRSSQVRREALALLTSQSLQPDEAPELERLLTRKAGDLRRGVIAMLATQESDQALASARRLWTGSSLQRDAACELLCSLEPSPALSDLASRFTADGVTPEQAERLATIVADTESVSRDPRLGLFSADDLSAPDRPERGVPGRLFGEAVGYRIVDALDDLVEANRNVRLEVTNWQGTTESLLVDASWLPGPFGTSIGSANNETAGAMVMPEVFRTWWDDRPDDCRSRSDSLDVLSALVAFRFGHDHQSRRGRASDVDYMKGVLAPLVAEGQLQLRHPVAVEHVLDWLLAELADQAVIDECIDGAQAALSLVPDDWVEKLRGTVDNGEGYSWRDWRTAFKGACPWLSWPTSLFVRNPLIMTPDQLTRWYLLLRWFDQPVADSYRVRVDPAVAYAAHAIGAASDGDIYDHLIGSRWRGLSEFTRRHRGSVERNYPTVVPLADRLRDRIIEIEQNRGEPSTSATGLVSRISSVEGADLTMDLLARVGSNGFKRNDHESRDAIFSRLIRVSYPAPTDTADTLAGLVATNKIKDRRLVELAMFAPQWASLVEAVTGWDGLEDAIWWFYAHTTDDRWSVEDEVREAWAARWAERTPLDAEELAEGAVDVAWFARAYDRLGPQRWDELHKLAKLGSDGVGHRRAQLFADAMRGGLDPSELATRIEKKRHQDSVRALGLIPLPDDGGDEVALERYQILRRFEKGSKKFGSQRQRNEETAVRIGMENLARTARASDPQRFVWAMEAAETADLTDGPVVVTVDDLTVSLSVDGEGNPDIEIKRGDRPLKSVPAKMRKQPDIKALTDRRSALNQQVSRVRRSLEESMVRQDLFVEADFEALSRHPVVAPMLDLVIWIDDSGAVLGRSGSKWIDSRGASARPSGSLRIAHPVDLARAGEWIAWQEQFFDRAQRQPFKQAFRELYVLTEAEAADSPLSRRWAGHQLQSRQARGLFTARGWVTDWDFNHAFKVFHHVDLVARVRLTNGWGTPAEVESPTIDTIGFTRRSENLAQPLVSVPPVVFSETMRDLDLVVSVAHAGGVDPEATASTMEARAALVRETARLMGLENLTFHGSHVVIEGSLGEYSVHLGSGTVHRRPGGALCIIPVDAQRRGRVFLPFADEDPKSAEIVSKVLMLSRDQTIKDPTILEQLRS